MGYLLLFPVVGQTEDAAEHAVLDVVVQAQLHVVLHGEVVEQTDVLEGTGDARLVHLDGIHVVGVHAVQQNGAPGGLVHLGEQVKDSGLARAVGADETGNLGAADGHVEVLHGGQAAKVDAQVAALQNGAFINITLGNLVGAGHVHKLHRLFGDPAHCAPPFFSSALVRRRAKKP